MRGANKTEENTEAFEAADKFESKRPPGEFVSLSIKRETESCSREGTCHTSHRLKSKNAGPRCLIHSPFRNDHV